VKLSHDSNSVDNLMELDEQKERIPYRDSKKREYLIAN
jgi:hypothetical protein